MATGFYFIEIRSPRRWCLINKVLHVFRFLFRLKTDNNGGAWCPKHMVSNALKEYLQVDLLQTHVITAIRTQGRFGKGQGQEYTEAYVLEYWRPGFDKWQRWKNIQGKEVGYCLFQGTLQGNPYSRISFTDPLWQHQHLQRGGERPPAHHLCLQDQDLSVWPIRSHCLYAGRDRRLSLGRWVFLN